MHKRCLVLSLFVLFLSGCQDRSKDFQERLSVPDELLVMSWNCQNLFDAVDDGTEYPEFDPSRGEWTEARYRKRIGLMADILRTAGRRVPDILFLQEVENSRVVGDLNARLGKAGYRWVVVSDAEDRAIQLAILSRFPLQGVRFWSPGIFGEEQLRPVVEVRALIGRERMTLFNNHWKSKRGGVPETEPGRVLSADILSRRIPDGGLVVAAGDFNTELDDEDLAGYPERERAFCRWAGIGGESGGYLWITDSPDLLQQENRPERLLFDPWEMADHPGSYFYRDSWTRPDHFLMTSALFDGVGWEFQSMEVCARPPLVQQNGTPYKWITSSGMGYSDHLPILLRLVRLSGE